MRSRRDDPRHQTVKRWRPLARRRLRILRPFLVAIRARKPCVRLREILLGWNVLFDISVTPSGKIQSAQSYGRPYIKSTAGLPRTVGLRYITTSSQTTAKTHAQTLLPRHDVACYHRSRRRTQSMATTLYPQGRRDSGNSGSHHRKAEGTAGRTRTGTHPQRQRPLPHPQY